MKITLDNFLVILTLCFIVMRLAEVGAVKDWSWILVLSPLWVPIAIILLIALVIIISKVLTKKT